LRATTTNHIPLSITFGGMPPKKIKPSIEHHNAKFNVELFWNLEYSASFTKRAAIGVQAWNKWCLTVVHNEGPIRKILDEADRRIFIEAAWEGLMHTIIAAAEETIGRKSCKARDNMCVDKYK
jgi:hypothetical protein